MMTIEPNMNLNVTVSNFWSSVLEEVRYEEMRKRQLVDTARLMGFYDEKLKRLEEVLARAKTTDEAIEEFKRFKEEEVKVPEEERFKRLEDIQTNDNGYMAKIIGEEGLITYVKQGWEHQPCEA